MKNVLIFTTREGHLSICEAVKEYLEERGYKVKATNLVSKRGLNLYLPFYRYFPFLFKIPYKLVEHEKLLRAGKKLAERVLEKELIKEIKSKKPDLIISTNCFHNPAIKKVLAYQKVPIPFINVTTDPWTIHPILLSATADYNLVYDDKGIKAGVKNNIPRNRLVATGWFVRKRFYKKADREKVLGKLKFKDGVLTFLICGGSEGTNMILKIVPALLLAKKELQVIVVCGTNKRLYKAMMSMERLIRNFGKTKVERINKIPKLLNIKIVKFTKDLASLMTVADLVIGKAGPNLIFEAVAAKKPFFAICHISGQEDDNLPLIRKKGLGFVEENPIKAVKVLNDIVSNPGILKGFDKEIQKEREYNMSACKRLGVLVKKIERDYKQR